MDTLNWDYHQPLRGEPTTAGQRYSAQFKEQALALVTRQNTPATVIAQELGNPREIL